MPSKVGIASEISISWINGRMPLCGKVDFKEIKVFVDFIVIRVHPFKKTARKYPLNLLKSSLYGRLILTARSLQLPFYFVHSTCLLTTPIIIAAT
jgi:hypothetical protein